MTSRRTKQFRIRVERVTFVIKAENRSDILVRVVQLFRALNVEVEALYMVRRRGSETMRLHVTVEANEEVCRRIEANFYEVANVRSVTTEPSTKKVLSEALDEKLGGRDE